MLIQLFPLRLHWFRRFQFSTVGLLVNCGIYVLISSQKLCKVPHVATSSSFCHLGILANHWTGLVMWFPLLIGTGTTYSTPNQMNHRKTCNRPAACRYYGQRLQGWKCADTLRTGSGSFANRQGDVVTGRPGNAARGGPLTTRHFEHPCLSWRGSTSCKWLSLEIPEVSHLFCKIFCSYAGSWVALYTLQNVKQNYKVIFFVFFAWQEAKAELEHFPIAKRNIGSCFVQISAGKIHKNFSIN